MGMGEGATRQGGQGQGYALPSEGETLGLGEQALSARTDQKSYWVLLYHSRLPVWPRSISDHTCFGPEEILSLDGFRITVRWRPRLGGTLVCATQQLKHYYDLEDFCGEE